MVAGFLRYDKAEASRQDWREPGVKVGECAAFFLDAKLKNLDPFVDSMGGRGS